VVAGATGGTLALTNLLLTQAGYYFVSITYNSGTNIGATVASSVASLTIQDAARLTTQPQDFILPSGTNATFSVAALGQAPLTYQWQYNGTNLTDGGRIRGSTSNTLSVSGLLTSDSGGYAVIVSNVFNSVTSRLANLSVYDPPFVSVPPANLAVLVGSNAVFSFTPGGSPPFTFGWMKGTTPLSNGGRISGVGTANLAIASTTTNDSGFYSVSITNPVGSVTSAPVTLSVLMAPVFTSKTNASGKQGFAFTNFQATVTGSPPITFGAQGLPAGLMLDPSKGVLSGIPQVFGVFQVTLFATNPAVITTTNLTITLASDVPGITSKLTGTGTQGTMFAYTINASNNPVTFTATGLPPGIDLNPTNGALSGPPLVSGVFPVTITASNQFGGDSKTLTLTIASAVPVITSPLMATGAEDTPGFVYTITATNAPVSFGAIGLPTGLTLDTNSGIIQGMPIYGGTNNVVISAANAYGVGSAILQIGVTYATPPALAIINVTNTYASPYLLDFTFTLRDDPNAATNASIGNAISRPPEQIQALCLEGDTNLMTSTEIGDETAAIINRVMGANGKKLKTFFVLDYTYSIFIVPGAISNMQTSAEALINAEPPSAQFGVYEFSADDKTPGLVSTFTSDKALLTREIGGIQTNFVNGDYAGSTFIDALYDALGQFSGMVSNEQHYLIVMSDGYDDSSTNSTDPKPLIALANTNGVSIYCVGFGPNPNTALLQQLATDTQGRYYPAAAAADVPAQFALLLKDLNSQYTLRWATLDRNPTNAFQPMFQVTIDGVPSQIYNPFNVSITPATTNTNSMPPVTNAATTNLIIQSPYYTNSLYAGNIKQGALNLYPDASSNVSSVTLNAFYVPRFVRALRLHYVPNYPCTALLQNTNLGEVLSGWSLTQSNDGAGGQYLYLASPNTNDVLTSLPYGITADLVQFQFQYQAVPNPTNAFSAFTVDNTIYSNMPPSGQTFVLAGTNGFITPFPPAPPHGTPVPWLASYGFTNNPATDELLPSPNGNGLLLWQDYIAGLNPTAPNATFAILPGTMQSGKPPVISFNTVLGRTYRVDYSVTLGVWSTLRDNITGTGGVVSVTDNRNLGGVSNVYYRLSVIY
jgi:hypothetical protein